MLQKTYEPIETRGNHKSSKNDVELHDRDYRKTRHNTSPTPTLSPRHPTGSLLQNLPQNLLKRIFTISN
ncbi:hypothetical protein H5410_048342 [Solanum commersonii]|uniref:Uncharacterized protein n=1 Tax=Solanum commersonii TaxID=4109 RepID=A0A9J5XKU1_SOLCO|nr:hypothetical protein H5410_048342 [Solanum commersonii]